ncbi:hypothetical protein F4810DRAFT_725665 [Camillea tinctor]|nr:hypothetical protein F4810DRAFT_725665 [Camillea tinctor]
MPSQTPILPTLGESLNSKTNKNNSSSNLGNPPGSFTKFVHDVIKQADNSRYHQKQQQGEAEKAEEILRRGGRKHASTQVDTPSLLDSTKSTTGSQEVDVDVEDHPSCVTHGPQLREIIIAEVNRRLEELLPLVEALATEVAKQELARLTSSWDEDEDDTKDEEDEEEQNMRMLRDRELSTDDLEKLLSRRDMAEVLRRLLERLDLEASCDEWEELVPKRKKSA